MEVIRLCRLCLTFSEYHANIFFEKIKDKELWRLVNSVCELNTFLYDGLPEHICVDCEYTLKKTLSFRNRAIEATSALKLMIQRNKDLWQKSEWDASRSSKATPKVVQVETLEGTKAVVQPALATPPSMRSTVVNKVSGMGSVADASSKKSKCLRSPGKSSQRKSNPLSPGRTRTVKVEKPSCDNQQGTSSEKDPTQQSMSEHHAGTENKVARPFVCQQCGASYVRKHFLEKHEVAHRNKPTYTTSGQRLRSKRYLNSQKQFYSHVRPYSTRSSDLKNFQSLDASEETARKSFEGESSSVRTSPDKSIEIRDTNKTINEKDLRADVVQEEISEGLSKSILNERKSELSKPTFVCDICKRSFPKKQNLGNHVRVHNGERPFSCNICDKTFRQHIARYCHELRHIRDTISFGNSEEGNEKKQFSCTICGKNFSTKLGLRMHFNIHTDKFKCNSCGRRFQSSSHLSSHSRTHTKEKPFKCEVCLKRFSMKSNLKTHLLIHSTERPFSCEICDKTFKTKQGMTEHELNHLRIK